MRKDKYVVNMNLFRNEAPELVKKLTLSYAQDNQASFIEDVDKLNHLFSSIGEDMLSIHCGNLKFAARKKDDEFITSCLQLIEAGTSEVLEKTEAPGAASKTRGLPEGEIKDISRAVRTIGTAPQYREASMKEIHMVLDEAEKALSEKKEVAEEPKAEKPQDPKDAAAEITEAEAPKQEEPKTERAKEQIPKQNHPMQPQEPFHEPTPVKIIRNEPQQPVQQQTAPGGQPVQPELFHEDHDITGYTEHQLFTSLYGLIEKGDVPRAQGLIKLLEARVFAPETAHMLKIIEDELAVNDISNAVTQTKMLLAAVDSGELADKGDTKI